MKAFSLFKWLWLGTMLFSSDLLAADLTGDIYEINFSSSTSIHEITIERPDKQLVTSQSSLVAFDPPLADGIYKYSISSQKSNSNESQSVANNGRSTGSQPSSVKTVIVETGAFRILNQTLVKKEFLKLNQGDKLC